MVLHRRVGKSIKGRQDAGMSANIKLGCEELRTSLVLDLGWWGYGMGVELAAVSAGMLVPVSVPQ